MSLISDVGFLQGVKRSLVDLGVLFGFSEVAFKNAHHHVELLEVMTTSEAYFKHVSNLLDSEFAQKSVAIVDCKEFVRLLHICTC